MDYNTVMLLLLWVGDWFLHYIIAKLVSTFESLQSLAKDRELHPNRCLWADKLIISSEVFSVMNCERKMLDED